jgi:SAM-dependent methyltransferase
MNAVPVNLKAADGRILPPSNEVLSRLFQSKYGDLRSTGWSPRWRQRFGYYTPDDVYEALVANLVSEGCLWLDVGGGRHLFPDNPGLAAELADRCALLVGVDPSETLQENGLVHRRVQCAVEDYRADRQFDLATLRMVAEHIADPDRALASLARLVKAGGNVVVYTVNRWSPVSLLAWLVPFKFHHAIKRVFWGTEEKDTFSVCYKLNTRAELAAAFGRHGFRERYFAHLSDCRVFHRSRAGNLAELSLWRTLTALGLPYPETCLLGAYQRVGAEP